MSRQNLDLVFGDIFGTLLTWETPSPYSSANGLHSLNSIRLRTHRLLTLKRGKIANQQNTGSHLFMSRA